jgi:CDI immunity proteins
VSSLRPYREKSVNELEGATPSCGSDARLAKARAIPITTLTDGDLRYLIRHRIAISYLVPSALERLEAKPLANASWRAGDLLLAVLRADAAAPIDAAIRPRLAAIVAGAIEVFSTEITDELELDSELVVPELLAAQARFSA